MTRVDAARAPGPHGPVPLRVYGPDGALPAPRASAAPLLWAHGGGWVGGDLGMPESHDVALAIAARGRRVVAVGYRLVGDGVAYPVPHDDVDAAYRWAMDSFGAPVVLGGASAGANLAAGVALRHAGDAIPPAGAVLAYPLLHRVVPEPGEPPERAGIDPEAAFPPERVAAYAEGYLGGATEAPFAFPGDGTIAAFPPTLIVTSDRDDLRPSGEAFAAQLRRAGVEVRLEREPGTLHGHLNLPTAPAFARTIDRIVRWLDERDARTSLRDAARG